MPWIDTINTDDAHGELKELYDTFETQYGFVPNIRRALSLNPPALHAYIQLSNAVYRGGPLAAVEREMVATVVSACNDCHY